MKKLLLLAGLFVLLGGGCKTPKTNVPSNVKPEPRRQACTPNKEFDDFNIVLTPSTSHKIRFCVKNAESFSNFMQSTDGDDQNISIAFHSPDGKILEDKTIMFKSNRGQNRFQAFYQVDNPADGEWAVNVVNKSSAVRRFALRLAQTPKRNKEPVARVIMSTINSTTIKVDATSSTDEDGIITKYFWEFGDGEIGSDPVMEHKYNKPGSYFVTLVVEDNSGNHGFGDAPYPFHVSSGATSSFKDRQEEALSLEKKFLEKIKKEYPEETYKRIEKEIMSMREQPYYLEFLKNWYSL